MFLWRVSHYANLDGIGGLYASGRWHSRGHPIVYCSRNPATALLEMLVHLEIDAEDRPEKFQVLKIEVPDAVSRETVEVGSLPEVWMTDLIATQGVGDGWLRERRSALLEVPSVLVPETWNVLVNPVHGDVSQLKIVAVYDHAFDVRLAR